MCLQFANGLKVLTPLQGETGNPSRHTFHQEPEQSQLGSLGASVYKCQSWLTLGELLWTISKESHGTAGNYFGKSVMILGTRISNPVELKAKIRMPFFVTKSVFIKVPNKDQTSYQSWEATLEENQ